MSSTKVKSVSLTFRGFEVEPDIIEQLMGAKANSIGRIGSPIKAGVKTLLKRSFVEFSVSFSKDSRLDEMIPILLSHLGGVNNITMVREYVLPEFFEINFTLPIKSSDEQESGFIPAEVIMNVFKLGCSLSFDFS